METYPRKQSFWNCRHGQNNVDINNGLFALRARTLRRERTVRRSGLSDPKELTICIDGLQMDRGPGASGKKTKITVEIDRWCCCAFESLDSVVVILFRLLGGGEEGKNGEKTGDEESHDEGFLVLDFLRMVEEEVGVYVNVEIDKVVGNEAESGVVDCGCG